MLEEHLPHVLVTARQAERPGGRWPGALASFQSRLAWRDHFIQKLEDEPAIELRALHRAADDLRPREPEALRLAMESVLRR